MPRLRLHFGRAAKIFRTARAFGGVWLGCSGATGAIMSAGAGASF